MATRPTERIAAGKRDKRITVQQLTETHGTAGEPIESWSTLCTLWANAEVVDAPERFTEGMLMDQITARAWIKFTVPYRVDMDPLRVDVPKRRRVMFLARVYDVAAAALIGRQAGVELLTLSKVG